MFSIEGKSVLVTGVGRREGIGFAICSQLAERKARVFFTYWSQYDRMINLPGASKRVDVLKTKLQQFGTQIESGEFDLSVAENIPLLYKNVKEKFGVPDILVNNACYSTSGSLATVTEEMLDAHYAVNVRATTLLCAQFAEDHSDSERVIVNMTSGQAVSLMQDELAYTITKAGVDMLTKQLAPELKEKNIRIYAVDPGPTDTGWMTPSLKETIIKESSSHTIHTPNDAASLVVCCITNSEYESGSVIHAER